MEPIEFPEQTVVIAKDQPEYLPLPVYEHGNYEGEITFCWQLSLKERIKLLFTGVLWHSVFTFELLLQPQLLSTDKPGMKESKGTE